MWTVAELMRTLAERGDHPALATVSGDAVEELSGADLARLIRHLASGFHQSGIGRGDVVLLIGPNSAAWVVARLAVALVGAVAVACDDQSSAGEIAAVVGDSGCRAAFASRHHATQVRAASPACAIYLLEEAGEDEERSWRDLLASEPLTASADQPADAPAMIVYTSGTTGAPKSFILTNANMAANIDALLAERVIGPEDRILLPLPLHHVFPLLVGMLTTLASGATLVFPAAVTGPQIAAAIRLANITVIVGVPRLYAALLGGIEARVAARGALARRMFAALLALSVGLQRRLAWRLGRRLFAAVHRQIGPALRVMVSGGAKLEAPIIGKLEGLGWEVLSGYGLAETASMFTGNLPRRKRLGSEGCPLDHGQIRIHEPDAQGIGEIQLRGPNVFAGYRNNPEANRTAFTEDGWFRTGDLGSLDADGFLTVTGRLKEMIVLGGGKNIMPEELERHYAANPYIHEIAVLERDGKLVALVVPETAAIRAAAMTRPEDAVRVALAERAHGLPPYQRLAGFALAREPLPRTRLGKYQRFLLAGIYDAIQRGEDRPQPRALSHADRALVGASPAKEVWALLSERYRDKGITLDSNLALDLGLDSLEWMTVALELEARLHLHLTEEAIARAVTVRDLLAEARVAASAPTAARDIPVALDPERWLRPTGIGATFAGLLLYGVNWCAMRLLFRVRARGRQHVPSDGAFVLIANHASDLDPFVLAAALPLRRLRRLYWAGEVSRLFESPWGRGLARTAHIFPVIERAPAVTLAYAKRILEQDLAVGWFPESWRTPTGELQRFLPGIGVVLLEKPVTVVPAYIGGSFAAMPRTRRLPRLRPITVTFGPPIAADLIRALGQQANGRQRILATLEKNMADLERTAK